MNKLLRLTKTDGQSLMEVVIALGLLIVVVTAIAITTTQGLQNSKQSQRQVQAVQLTQEGIDRARNSAKLNCSIQGTSDTFWSGTYPQSYNVLDNCTLQKTTSGVTVMGDFTRNILIEDNSTNLKKITVTVTWNDSSGNHKSEQITYVSR